MKPELLYEIYKAAELFDRCICMSYEDAYVVIQNIKLGKKLNQLSLLELLQYSIPRHKSGPYRAQRSYYHPPHMIYLSNSV